jgi:hypothetical protein
MLKNRIVNNGNDINIMLNFNNSYIVKGEDIAIENLINKEVEDHINHSNDVELTKLIGVDSSYVFIYRFGGPTGANRYTIPFGSPTPLTIHFQTSVHVIDFFNKIDENYIFLYRMFIHPVVKANYYTDISINKIYLPTYIMNGVVNGKEIFMKNYFFNSHTGKIQMFQDENSNLYKSIKINSNNTFFLSSPTKRVQSYTFDEIVNTKYTNTNTDNASILPSKKIDYPPSNHIDGGEYIPN